LEDLRLNPGVYLIKPQTEQEFHLSLQIKRSKDALDRKDYNRYKNKLSRYNRVISLIAACKNKSSAIFEYLLDSPLLRHFWTKKDFYSLLHIICTNVKVWEFSIPILMQSHLARRWFFSENEINKTDIFYRLQRQFSIKILLDDMVF
jgi:hypothetical protein